MGYLYLALAIAGELIGTTYLKYSEGFTKLVPSVISIISYGLCFFIFSKSLLTINLSVAYATWSAVGLIITTLISIYIFKEGITPAGVAAHNDHRRSCCFESIWYSGKSIDRKRSNQKRLY